MSTIAVNAITDANGGSTTSINGTTPNAYNTVGKNLIINGAMQIAQRGTSSTTTGYTTVDRFTTYANNTDELAFSLEQSTDAPDGFSNSFKWTTTTAETTIDSNEHVGFQQKLEGQSLQQLAHGTTSAKKVTLSFWVKSSVTGTFAATLFKTDSSRIIGFTYTINTANTWEKKAITFDGDTSGSIPNDNSRELDIIWHLLAGSDFTSTDNTSWVTYTTGTWAYGHAQNGVIATTNATWQITGVQLEVGESATEFEHRPYATEFQLCERYFKYFVNHPGTGRQAFISGMVFSTSDAYAGITFSAMRTAPTVTLSGTFDLYRPGALNSATAASSSMQTDRSMRVNFDLPSGYTAGYAFWAECGTSGASISLDAEL